MTTGVGALVLTLAPGTAAAQPAAPAPMAAVPGTVLEYRTVQGTPMQDSVAESGAGRVVLVRRITAGGTETATTREIWLAADGFRQRDAGGEQLVIPRAWPPRDDWESLYRGARLRYTWLGEEEVTVPSGTYTAAHLQLAVLGTTTTFVDLWVVPDLGIVRRSTRGGGLASDYELVAVRVPSAAMVAQRPAGVAPARRGPATRTTEPSTAVATRGESRWYLGGGAWWFDREISRRAHETDNTSMGLLGWHIESGVAGPIGVRARYGQADEQFTSDARGLGLLPARIHFVTAEVLLALTGSAGRLYLGGGGQWTADRRAETPAWTSAAVGTLGLDTGLRRVASLYAEIQWASGGVPIHLSSFGAEPKGGGMIVAGLRVH